jgi:hypothetical protein
MKDSGGTQHAGGYNLLDFHDAVIEGKDTNGNELYTEMQSWRMSDKDRADLFMFLKTIPQYTSASNSLPKNVNSMGVSVMRL